MDIGGGGGIFIGGKATPYGVGTTIIFVYERGEGCVDVMDIYDWGLIIIICIIYMIENKYMIELVWEEVEGN